MQKKYPFFLICLLFVFSANAQLNVTVDSSALQMAQIIVGPGISVSNATYIGNFGAAGLFSGNTNVGISSGVLFTNGLAENAIGPNDSTVSWAWNSAGDSDLANAIGQPDSLLFDACGLEFDFVVPTDSISFNYVFGSEEYLDYTCSEFDDAFALFISGPGITGLKNIALIPGTNVPVSINTVNSGVPGFDAGGDDCGTTYPQYYVDNGCYDNTGFDMYEAPNDSSPYYVQYNGLTTLLKASLGGLSPCHVYHLKIIISDVGDGELDSGIFIEGGFGSTTNTLIAAAGFPYTTEGQTDIAVANCSEGIIPIVLNHPATRDTVIHFTVSGTGVSGTDYTPIADSVTFGVGDSVENVLVQPLLSGYTGSKTVVVNFLTNCGNVDSVTLYMIQKLNVMVTPHDTGICLGQMIQLMATGGVTYSWTPSEGLSESNIADPLDSPEFTTTYVCTSTVGACSSSDTLRVTVDPFFFFEVSPPDTSICEGATVELMAGGATSYRWIPTAGLSSDTGANIAASPVTSTDYICIASNGGCSLTDTIYVDITHPFTVTVSPHDTTICAGDTVDLSASGVASYSWSPSAFLSSTSVANPVATPAVTTTYTCSYSAGGCSTFDTARITVGEFTVMVSPHDTSICAGDTVQLSATGGVSYSWTPATHLSNASIANPVATPVVTTTYTATYSIGNCSSSDTSLITITQPSVTVSITPNDTSYCPGGGPITLNAGVFKTYLWQNGSTGQYYSATDTGVYWVVVTDSAGCTLSDTIVIPRKCNPNLAMPSAFTPNGDGKNDFFLPSYINAPLKFSMHIYDRWGALLFETDNIANGWDGNFKGKKQPPGTYVYYIQYTFFGEKQQGAEGAFELLR